MKTPAIPDRFLAGVIAPNWLTATSPPPHHGFPRHQSSKGWLLAVTLILGVHSAHAQTALDLLQRFNVLVGDYNMNGETEGSVYVNGAFNPGGTHQIGFNSGALPSDTDYGLWLNNGRAGTASGTTQLQSGSVLSRVAVNPGDFNLNGNAPGDPGITSGTLPWETTLATQLGLGPADDPVQLMKDTSTYWAGLSANSTATFGSNSITLTATPVSYGGTMIAIFAINSADITPAIGSYDLILNGADAVLINVFGTEIDLGSGKNFIGGFVGNESRTMFNFQEATTLALNSNFRGTIFAPNATVTQNGSNLDGSVVASVFNQNAEVHNYNFDGDLPIPEPSVLLFTALGPIALLCRRRRFSAPTMNR